LQKQTQKAAENNVLGYKANLKGSDDATKRQELLGFWTLSIARNFKLTRKHNISETGSASVFRLGEGDTYCVGFLRKS
jgi:hypothetical protein